MGAPNQVRRCHCGTQLSRSNRGTMCAACTKKARTHRDHPPSVPSDFWQIPEMQAALAACDMGEVMRAFRTHSFHGRDISQEVAAGWVGITQPRLSRIENGEQITDLKKLMRWAHVLGIPADLLWFRMPGATTKPRGAVASQADGSNNQELAPLPESSGHGGVLLPVMVGSRSVLVPLDASTLASSGLGVLLDELAAHGAPRSLPVSDVDLDAMSPLSRRSLLTRGIAVAALPVLGLDELQHVAKALDDARRYFDGPVVDYFSRQIGSCMADDGAIGARKTLPVMLGILGVIEEHAREVKPAVRRELLSVGAQGAEFCGWLYRDIQEVTIAGYWHDRGMEWAQEAGDTAMQGYLLLKKSQMAYDERDALRVLTLAQAAQAGPWQLPIRVQAEVTQQEALGLAMLGEPIRAVEHKLDDAGRLLTQAAGEEQHGLLGAYFNDYTLRLRNASCYTEAGRPGQAAELFAEVLTNGLLSRRDAGYFRARRAVALALSGEPDEAATTGLESVEVARATNSQRTLRVLAEVVQTLTPWRSRPGPRELREALLA